MLNTPTPMVVRMTSSRENEYSVRLCVRFNYGHTLAGRFCFSCIRRSKLSACRLTCTRCLRDEASTRGFACPAAFRHWRMRWPMDRFCCMPPYSVQFPNSSFLHLSRLFPQNTPRAFPSIRQAVLASIVPLLSGFCRRLLARRRGAAHIVDVSFIIGFPP